MLLVFWDSQGLVLKRPQTSAHTVNTLQELCFEVFENLVSKNEKLTKR